jgi:hypothetical protein
LAPLIFRCSYLTNRRCASSPLLCEVHADKTITKMAFLSNKNGD